MRFLYPFASKYLYVLQPAGFSALGYVLRGTEPCRMYPEAGKPQYPPLQLGVDVAWQKAHKPRMRTARDDGAGGLAAEKSLPENGALPCLSLYIAEGGTGKPSSVKYSF